MLWYLNEIEKEIVIGFGIAFSISFGVSTADLVAEMYMYIYNL